MHPPVSMGRDGAFEFSHPPHCKRAGRKTEPLVTVDLNGRDGAFACTKLPLLPASEVDDRMDEPHDDLPALRMDEPHDAL